jgi:hypothetical protein
MASSLTGRLRRGLLNSGWSHHRDGTEEKWTNPDGDRTVAVDAPPGSPLRVVEAHGDGKHLLLRAVDGDTDAILRGLAELHLIPEEASHEAA